MSVGQITVNDGRFEVRFPYDGSLVALMKRVLPGAQFQNNPPDKYWRVSPTPSNAIGLVKLHDQYAFAMDDPAIAFARAVVEEGITRASMSTALDADYEVDGLGKTLRPYQKAAVAYASRAKRLLICDQMGVGKTVEGIAILQAMNAYPAVISVPNTVKLKWERELVGNRKRNISPWLPGKRVTRLEGHPDTVKANLYLDEYRSNPDRAQVLLSKRERTQISFEIAPPGRLKEDKKFAHVSEPILHVVKGKLPGKLMDITRIMTADVILLNHDVLSKWKPILMQLPLKGIILDESHRFSSLDAQRTRAARDVARGVNVRVLLSGTPIPSSPYQLVPQLQIMGRLEDFGGFNGFTSRYCVAEKFRFGTNYSKARKENLNELNERLKSTCYIRREKKDVLTELPDKQYSDIPVEITNKDDYKRAEDDVAKFIAEEAVTNKEFLDSIRHLPWEIREKKIQEHYWSKEARARRAAALLKITTLKQVAARGKVHHAIEWIREFLEDSDEKLVVFADHIEIQDTLREAFPNAARIYGADPTQKREEYSDMFQNDPSCRLIICSLKAGGEGIDLFAASNVLILEFPWTPGALEQAEDRLHRSGQKNAVTVWNMVADKTIDEDVISLLNMKRDVINAVVTGVADDASGGGSILAALLEKLTSRYENIGSISVPIDTDPDEL